MKIYGVQIGDTVMEMTAEEHKAYCKALEEESNKSLKEQRDKQISSQKDLNKNK